MQCKCPSSTQFATLSRPTYRIATQPAISIGQVSIHTLQGDTMGTSWSVKLWAEKLPPLPRLWKTIHAALDRVVAQMSTWQSDSDLSRFNCAAPGSWQQLPDECFYVLKHALALAKSSAGAYDPTIGSIVNLWGFGPRHHSTNAASSPIPPEPTAIQAARQYVGWQHITLDSQRQRILQSGNIYIDLSSIAKGFAVDLVVRHLREAGVQNALVEIGGELLGVGQRPDGQPWRVAIKRPGTSVEHHENRNWIIALRDRAVATSGDDFHVFEHGAKRYSHSIDPRTCVPVQHTLASVSVAHSECMLADALATALAVLGPIDGLRFAHEQQLAALFITRSHNNELQETMTTPFAQLLADAAPSL